MRYGGSYASRPYLTRRRFAENFQDKTTGGSAALATLLTLGVLSCSCGLHTPKTYAPQSNHDFFAFRGRWAAFREYEGLITREFTRRSSSSI